MILRTLTLAMCLLMAGQALPDRASGDTRLGILPRTDAAGIHLSGHGPALVQEHHVLSLAGGMNQVGLSWSGVSVDPDTVLFTPSGNRESVRVVSTAFSPDGAGLVWEIHSDQDRVVPVIISYQPAGMDGGVTYTATVHDREETLTLEARLVLRNFSGQSWPAASVWLDSRALVSTDILDRETRRIPVSLSGHPEIKKIFHWDGQTMPHDPEALDSPPGVPFGYRITHAPVPGSGSFALPPGNVRLFLKEGRGQTLFAGENFLPLLPAGDSFFLETGRNRDIIITKRRMKTEKTRIRSNDKGKLQVFDQTVTDRFIVRNTGATPAGIRLTDRIPGQWDPVDMGHAYTLEDHETLVFDIQLDAGETRTFDLTFDMRNIFADKFTQYNKAAQ